MPAAEAFPGGRRRPSSSNRPAPRRGPAARRRTGAPGHRGDRGAAVQACAWRSISPGRWRAVALIGQAAGAAAGAHASSIVSRRAIRRDLTPPQLALADELDRDAPIPDPARPPRIDRQLRGALSSSLSIQQLAIHKAEAARPRDHPPARPG
jgi:hypothetical protein